MNRSERRAVSETTTIEHGSLFRMLLQAVLPLTLLLASCASIGEKFSLEPVEKLQVGHTLMPEVRQLFGSPFVEIDVANRPPIRRVHFGDESTVTIWRYLYASGTLAGAESRILQVEFDKNRKVSDYFFSSDFAGDKTDETVSKDFDLLQAREKIIPGKTTKSEVVSQLGESYRLIRINKPNVVERWRYGLTKKSTEDKSAGAGKATKIYGKSLDIDFGPGGIVVDIRGESDFPADVSR